MAAVNLKQLAKILDLSISTVSKALRDSHEIGDATKLRVLAKAKEMDYTPNPFASGLRRNKSKTIAVVVPEVANNYFALAINGIERIAQENDYHVLIYLTHEDIEKEKGIMKHLENKRVDGVLMSVTMNTNNQTHLSDFQQKGIPIVFFDRICHEIETAKITTDDYISGINATKHLIENECKDIAFLSLGDDISIMQKRKSGYLEELLKNNMEVKRERIIKCGNDEEINYNLVKKLLSGKNKPDGIFASVEKLAITTYQVCRELNINIPNDIKIICFSNLETASLLSPSLSTITQPAYNIGKTAAEVMFKYLDKNKTYIPNENIVLQSTLHIRESSQHIV
ncbi:MAG: LacI family transcriptional regulator [Chitinophagaceae bacterium]|nr:LacI family transcriptional regulator [Chitinophagaceae bacterium]